jgi:hypothetical protein
VWSFSTRIFLAMAEYPSIPGGPDGAGSPDCCPARTAQNMWRQQEPRFLRRVCVNRPVVPARWHQLYSVGEKGKFWRGGQILMLPNATTQEAGLIITRRIQRFFFFEGIKLVGGQGRERNTSFSFSFIQRFRVCPKKNEECFGEFSHI